MGIILFIIYVIALLMIGLSSKKTTLSKDHFFVNGRQSSAATVASSILASCIGASATIGMVGLAFHVGMPAFWWLGSGVIGLLFLGYFLAAKVRAIGCYTLSDIVAKLLGRAPEKWTSIVVVLAWTSIVTAELVACTSLLQTLLAIEKLPALIIGCLLISLHTIFGGQGSIIRLDKLQFSIIFGTIALLLIWSVVFAQGGTSHIAIEFSNQAFPVNKAMYFCLILGGGYIVCPMLYGRVLSAKDLPSARRGVIASALVLAVVAMMIVFIGLLAQSFVPANTPNDEVLMTLADTMLPVWLAKCIYVFLLCVVVSSADACLFAASSALSRHLFKKEGIKANRWCSLVLMLIAALLTLTNQGILSYLLMANNIYACSIVIPVMLCLIFNKSATAIHQPVMLTGMVVSGILGFINALSDQYAYAYWGMFCSLCLTLLSFKRNQYVTAKGNL